MSPEQCRAARAWLDWSQLQLANRAEVSASTVRDFEAGRRIPMVNNLKGIRRALEDAGIHFMFTSDHEPVGVAFPRPQSVVPDKPKPARPKPGKPTKRRR